MFPKVVNILPIVGVLLCMPFQHKAVGISASNEDDSITTVLRADTSFAKKDSVISIADTSDEGETLKSKIKYHARDSMRVDMENEIVYLYGEATVDYEDLHLKADHIMIDMKKKELFAQGSTDSLGQTVGRPEFSQAQQQFRSHNIRYNFDTKKGKISYVITKEGEGYIHGEVVKKDPYNDFFIRNGAYTTCDQDTPHFAITSRKLKVVNNNKIVTGPAFLSIEGVPTPLIIPFGFFPNKKGRSSGVIFPSFGESAERGFYFQNLGYYFGFNDYVNSALTGDVYTLGSYTVNLSTVYANRYHYNGNFRLSYAKTVTSQPELPDYAEQKDFHINWTHSQDGKARPYSTFTASVNAGTSNYYRNTITSANNFLSNTFNSSVTWSTTFPDKPFNLGISANHSQNTLTHDMRITFPDISFGISRITIPTSKYQVGAEKWYQKIGASLSTRATNYIDTKDSLLFKPEALKIMKNGVQHSIPISTTIKLLKYFTLSPSVNFTERWYSESVRYNWNPAAEKIDTVTIRSFSAAHDYQASASVSTRIYGMFQFRGGPIAAIRHVMNPTVAFSYRPDYGDPKYGYYKTVQTDTLENKRVYSIYEKAVYGSPSNGRFGNIGFGLDNNLEMKIRANSDSGATLKKLKIFESIRLGGNYNLAADSMKLSPFSLTARTTIFDKLGLTFNSTLDPYAYDSAGRDYNRYLVDVTGQLVHLTSANFSANFSLAGKGSQVATGKHKYTREELDDIKQHPENYVDFNVPYNLTVSYTFSYSRAGDLKPTQNQSASMNGDLSLTDNWKIGFNSWYDFEVKTFTNFGLNIYRDLHCWEMRLNWIPFGHQESWSFQINVKSSMLQDLKLTKKKDFWDNQ